MMHSIYTSTTGLKAYANGMNAVGNNIANASTVGYKSTTMLFQDLMSNTIGGSISDGVANTYQLGMGTSLMTNRVNFYQQGALESASGSTDLAIGGTGFFGVQGSNGETYYTRAGNFRFNENGQLTDPFGSVVLGYSVNANGVASASASPIEMDMSSGGQLYMAAKQTKSATLLENLGSTTNLTSSDTNPYFALAEIWDGTSSPPLDSGQYSHTSSFQVYDEEGNVRTVQAYYDYVETVGGNKVYQYVLAVNPDQDGSALAGTTGAGLLAAGTLTFSSHGELINQTMFEPGADASDFSTWTPASFGADGQPQISATFVGAGGGSLAAQSISLNMGLNMKGSWDHAYASAADVAADPGSLSNSGKERFANSTTGYGGSSATMYSAQDGYGAGNLSSVQVGTDGIITAQYSNGQSAAIFQIPVYRFVNEDGLNAEANNYFTATADSGDPTAGIAGTENFGSIWGNYLEASTVDLSTEFTSMIITQRAFQMNSKVITTADTMLQKAIEIKR